MNITEDSINLSQENPDYYLTSDLTQRLDLISHLLANTDLIPFIQSPEGCGKTRLARHLADTLSDRYTVSLVSGGPMAGITDLRTALADIAGMSSTSEVSDDLLEEQFCKLAERNRNFLLLLDDADQLAADSLTWVFQFFTNQQAACNTKCVIFSAVDVLALPLGPVQLSSLKDSIQILDIPKFTLEQMRGFVDFIRGDEHEPLSDTQLQALQKQTRGVPGKVLWQVQFADLQMAPDNENKQKPEPWLKPLLVAAIAGFVVTVGLIIFFQDEINRYIAKDESADQGAEAELQTLVIPSQKSMPLVVTEKHESVNVSEPPIDKIPDVEVQPVVEPTKQASASAEVSAKAEEAVKREPASDTVSEAVKQREPQQVAEEPAVIEKVQQNTVLADIQSGKAKTGELVLAAEKQPAVKTPEVKVVKTTQVTKTLTAPEPLPAPVPVAAPKAPAPVSELNSSYQTIDWLIAQHDKTYTLQLLAVSDKAGIERFIKQHNLQGDIVIFETVRNDKPLYALLFGAFPSLDAAVAAKKRLPSSYKSSSAWPRAVISLKPVQNAN